MIRFEKPISQGLLLYAWFSKKTNAPKPESQASKTSGTPSTAQTHFHKLKSQSSVLLWHGGLIDGNLLTQTHSLSGKNSSTMLPQLNSTRSLSFRTWKKDKRKSNNSNLNGVLQGSSNSNSITSSSETTSSKS